MKDYRDALKKLLPMQRADFAGLFKEMQGTPVTIRTLDPPLHEFLPKREDLMVQVATLRAQGEKKNRAKIAKLSETLRAVEELHEFNPMLGHRGCRLGITYPDLTRMQARAIFEAAAQVAKKGTPVKPEVMIPLVGHVEELRRQKKIVLDTAKEVLGDNPSGVEFLVGTMIEVPRGALTADEIAKEADFFSFGTNDLTQMGFGLSRDDAGKFLGYYQEQWHPGEGPLRLHRHGRRRAARGHRGEERARREAEPEDRRLRRARGRSARPYRFFHGAGLDYVSCSPYRVPIARLAAAQAQLEKPVGD
jgi:pyruvate,orthophosphate dikinase